MAQIRPYQSSDLHKLTAVHREIDPKLPLTPPELAALLAQAHSWVLLEGGQVVGYAAVTPAPGLPGDSDLHGGILPTFRRQGLGSKLLQFVLSQLAGLDLSRTSCIVFDTQSPTALFLRRFQFAADHEEVVLIWRPPPAFSLPVWPAGFALERYPLATAINQFRRLYTASFGPQPWYQPYSADELRAILQAGGRSADEILFLTHEGRTAGFIWVQQLGPGEWQIEPLAVHPNFQGQGLGRRLLQAGLLEASTQGVSEVTITLWRDNEKAYYLYRQVGFVEDSRCFYLSYTAGSEQ